MGEWVTKNGHNLHISKTLISIMLWKWCWEKCNLFLAKSTT
uniref:Uncharacterized protein n=1 Tax=Anguilla anguilla TaxID=7936 RepID=A0A0E9P9U4_ANGAN